MRVCFLVNDLQLSGGVGVVLEHAHHLAGDHGFEVALTVPPAEAPRWRYRRLDGLPLLTPFEARQRRFDVAVATWWKTTVGLFDVPADRHAYFVQSLEDRFYPPGEVERLPAATSLGLPVAFITEARWIADLLGELRPEAPCFYVRNGIAKDVFAPLDEVRPNTGGPLRVLVEGNPAVWFKGVQDSVAATRAMTEPRVVTLVSPEPADAGALGVDRVLTRLDHAEMARLYAETDVVLKLSRVEGMFGPPLEGFHLGATCVVSPVTGHDEYVEHGFNGVVVDWDDVKGAGRWLDVLARDRRLLHHLRSNALETARGWPSWEQSGQFMAAALREIRRRPPPRVGDGIALFAADVRAGAEEARMQIHRREKRIAALEIERDDLRARAEDATVRYEELRATQAYRVGLRLRRLTAPMRLAKRVRRRRAR